MERLERNIDRGIAKYYMEYGLKYYMELADQLIGNNDYMEMEIAVKQEPQIIDKIMDLISQLEGTKLGFGVSARDVRQWKKDKKNGFSLFIQEKDKICEILSASQRERMAKSRNEIGRPNEGARSA